MLAERTDGVLGICADKGPIFGVSEHSLTPVPSSE